MENALKKQSFSERGKGLKMSNSETIKTYQCRNKKKPIKPHLTEQF